MFSFDCTFVRAAKIQIVQSSIGSLALTLTSIVELLSLEQHLLNELNRFFYAIRLAANALA